MTIVARGQVSSSLYPLLETFFIVNGRLFDPAEIDFAIFDQHTTGSQVYPPAGRQGVVVANAPVGDRLSLGRYVASWQVPADAVPGRYMVRWWYRLLVDDTVEFTFEVPFEIVTSMALHMRGPCYTQIVSMREEGVAQQISDMLLHQKLVMASKLFEQFTGRTFTARYRTLFQAPSGSRVLFLDEPIIAVESVTVGSGNFDYDPAANLGLFRVYNRHITEGLTDPDDRENPRIEYATLGYFADGYGFGFHRQASQVRGVFGYTDPDGSPMGGTPALVSRAVALMAFKDLAKLADMASRDDATKRWRLTGESTRDQSYTMFGGVDAATRGALVGGTTGDPEIDNIIHLYRRGPRLGAA